MALCPECEAQLALDETEMDEGAVISCPDCGSDLEIVNAHPLELNAVDEDDDEDEDEDFDNDEDLDDDDDLGDEDEDLDDDDDGDEGDGDEDAE